METLEQSVKKCEKSVSKCRSFFVKRLEQHFIDKGIKIPEGIFTLFDTPFSQFTPEYKAMYEQKIKGQALFHIFSDMLVEIYQELDADKSGWEAAANYLEDTPMRICALLAMKRIDELEELPDSDYLYMVEQFNSLSEARITPREQKFGVRPYTGAGRSHWWKREDQQRLESNARN
ncbi:MAG: hypothetical protein AB1384_09155 [Actinomycetota bacterium]